MNVRMLRRSAGGTAIVLTLLSALGCGGDSRPNKITVTGTVTYDGKPVDGMIQFVLNEANVKGGDNATGSVINGKFSVSSVTPGKNSVVVTGGGSKPAAAAAAPPGKMGMENRPQVNMRNPKEMMATTGKGADNSIPSNAPGNSQEFDIGGKDGTNLDIKILKK